MKKHFTKSLAFLVLLLATIFNSCETQEQAIKNTQKVSFKEYTMKEANEIPLFRESKSKVDKIIANQISKGNANAREVLGFIIDEALIKEITLDGYVSYNMLIKREIETTDYFENLVIEVKNDSTKAYLVKYTPENGNIQNYDDINDFQGSIDARELITTLGGGLFGSNGDDDTPGGGGGSCVTIYLCFTPDDDIPNLSIPHFPYCGGCVSYPFSQCGSSIVQINSIPGVTMNSPNYIPHGGNSGSNTNNNTTVTTNPVVVPVGPAPINLDFPPATDNGLYETNIITTQFYNPLPHNKKGYLHQNQATRLIYQSICDYLELNITNDIINPEALSFANDIIAQMMQNQEIFTSITPFIIEKNIDDSQLDPCSKGVLNAIRNSQNNDVATIIAKLDSSPSIYNTKIIPVNLGTSGTNLGITQWTGAFMQGNLGTHTPFDYKVGLNSVMINQGTKIQIYASMLHELIHAYFLSIIDDCLASNNGCQQLMDLPYLWNQFVSYKNGNSPTVTSPISQHNQLANSYVNTIINALQEYQPGLPQQLYSDLAWGGLEGTIPYENNDPTTRQLSIQDRVRVEVVNRTEALNLTQTEFNSNNTGQVIATHVPQGVPCD